MRNTYAENNAPELDTIKYIGAIKTYVELGLSLFQLFVVTGLPLGFLYLLAYAVSNKVPIPLSLSELPSLLLSVTALGTMFAFIFFGFMFMPAIGKLRLFGRTFSFMYGSHTYTGRNVNASQTQRRQFVSKRRNATVRQRRRKNRTVFFFTMGLPLFSFLVLLLGLSMTTDAPQELTYGAIALATIASGASVFFGIQRYFNKRRRVEIHVVTWSLLGICAYWALLVLMLILKGLVIIATDSTAEIGAWIMLLLSPAAMVLVLYFMVVPRVDAPALPPRFWVTIGAFLVFTPPMITPISAKLASYALSAMRVGGGYLTVYTLRSDRLEAIPCQILNEDGYAQTTRVQVVLDLGERIYLRVGDEKQVYVLPRETIVAQVM